MVALFFAMAGCRSTETSPEPAPRTPPPAQQPLPVAVPAPASSPPLPTITADELRVHVEHLADDALRGRPTPSPELDAAAAYLVAQLRELGLRPPPGAPEYLQRFECGGDARPGPASNVLALLPGRDPAVGDQVVMLSAHYDHLGERDGDDPVLNGANDNASGVAAMLAIVRSLAASPPRRAVLVAAFCGEELGLLGSRHYAEHPVIPLEQVVADVNLEMLGRPDPGEPVLAWVTGEERSELGAWLAAANRTGPVRFVDGAEIGPVEGAAFNRSDNFPLALRGVVAHSVSTGHLDELYHSPADEPGTLDYEGMAVVVQAIARGVHHVAESEDRPRWLDPPTE